MTFYQNSKLTWASVVGDLLQQCSTFPMLRFVKFKFLKNENYFGCGKEDLFCIVELEIQPQRQIQILLKS